MAGSLLGNHQRLSVQIVSVAAELRSCRAINVYLGLSSAYAVER